MTNACPPPWQVSVADLLAWMSDCVAANLASYRDSLAGPFPYSDHNGCLPHTGAHVGEHMETPHVDEYMGLYNACVGTSNYAVVHFAEITGYAAKKKSETRWFSTNDVQELSRLPNALSGKLLKWADRMIEEGVCEKTAPKMRAFLLHPTKSKLFALELTVVVGVGKSLKARNTKLEGDTFEFITGYDTITHMGDAIKDPVQGLLPWSTRLANKALIDTREGGTSLSHCNPIGPHFGSWDRILAHLGP